jgi:biopolymer transport protein TolR
MAMTSAGAEKASAEINVTPLIDVLLVLLIIFMVVRPTRYLGEKAEIPRSVTSSVANPQLEEMIVLRLLDTGGGERPAVAINRSRVDWQDLEARLRVIYSQRSGKEAFVQGDPEVDFQYVADVVDISRQAGATRVGLLGKNN